MKVKFVFMLLLMFSIFGCSNPTSSSEIEKTETEIDSEGGTLEVTDETSPYLGAKITVPPGAVSHDTIFSIEPGPSIDSENPDWITPSIHFNSSAPFSGKIEITLPLKEEYSGEDYLVTLMYLDGEEPVYDSTLKIIEAGDTYVSFEVDHFSGFGAMLGKTLIESLDIDIPFLNELLESVNGNLKAEDLHFLAEHQASSSVFIRNHSFEFPDDPDFDNNNSAKTKASDWEIGGSWYGRTNWPDGMNDGDWGVWSSLRWGGTGNGYTQVLNSFFYEGSYELSCYGSTDAPGGLRAKLIIGYIDDYGNRKELHHVEKPVSSFVDNWKKITSWCYIDENSPAIGKQIWIRATGVMIPGPGLDNGCDSNHWDNFSLYYTAPLGTISL